MPDGQTEVTFHFHRSLYLPDAVKAVAETFEPYCTEVEISESALETVVTLRGYDEGYGDALGDEFANHALFQTVVRSRETLGGVPV